MSNKDANRGPKGGKGAQRDNVFKRGERWYVRLWVDGREIRKSAGRSRQGAQLLLARLRTDAERGRVGLGKAARATMADFAPRYMEWAKAHKRAWATDARLLRFLQARLGSLRLDKINPATVEAYKAARREDTAATTHARAELRRAKAAGKEPPPLPKVSGPSVNREVACLRKLLSLAVQLGELNENPIRGLRMFAESPARRPHLDPEQEAALLGACRPWLASIVRVALVTACRQSELLALRWKHVDFARGALTVADSKTGDSRTVPLHPAALAELAARRGLPDGFLFVLPAGGPPAVTYVQKAFRKAAKSAGLLEFRFHDLRHVAATRLLLAGASLPEVKAFTGHKTLAMVERYAHPDGARLPELVARLPVGLAVPRLVK